MVTMPILLLCLSVYYAQTEDGIGRQLLANDCNVSESHGEHGAYPPELFTQEQKNKGAILLYLLGAIYSFIGLYYVCDVHFEPSLDEISESLGLSDDVAGATFMAAGSSAPELFTSIMGVFVARSDVGIGTIVGSAVFNMLCIIGLCGIMVGRWSTKEKPINIQMNWYVVFRDIAFYSLSIVVLIWGLADQNVNAVESGLLFGVYVLYVIWMVFNEKIDKAMHDWVDKYEAGQEDDNHPNAPSDCQRCVRSIVLSVPFEIFMMLVIATNVAVVIMTWTNEDPPDIFGTLNIVFCSIYFAELFIKLYGLQVVGYFKDIWNLLDFILIGLIIIELALSGWALFSSASRGIRLIRFVRGFRAVRVTRSAKLPARIAEARKRKSGAAKKDGRRRSTRASFRKLPQTGSIQKPSGPGNPTTHDGRVAQLYDMGSGLTDQREVALSLKNKMEDSTSSSDDSDSDSDEEYDEPISPWGWPDEGEELTCSGKAFWIASWPVYTTLYYTIPPCKAKAWKDSSMPWYMVSFFMSVVWISFYCYLMVWMAGVMGETFGIPVPVMGLTFLAAGTSLPDALASLSVARKGRQDQAVANANGSNVFDICIGLAIPWFIAYFVWGRCSCRFGSVNPHSVCLVLDCGNDTFDNEG